MIESGYQPVMLGGVEKARHSPYSLGQVRSSLDGMANGMTQIQSSTYPFFIGISLNIPDFNRHATAYQLTPIMLISLLGLEGIPTLCA